MTQWPHQVRERERRILENASTAVFFLDPELRLLYVNAAGEELLALSQRQLLGLHVSEMFVCSGGFKRHLEQVVATNQPFTERQIQLDLIHGGTALVDCAATPLSARDGEPGVLLEVQQVDRHLRISREEQLISQQEVTRDLVRGMAHEIKNPLGGLRGAAQLLEAELGDPELAEYTQIIIGEADRLQALVDRMLGPNSPPELREVHIAQVLERVRALVQVEAGRGLVIDRDYDPSIPPVRVDEDQLIQAVLNIVRNAARAVENSGRILLRTRVQRQFTIGNIRHRLVAQIDIIDNGPGVPLALQQGRLFYPMVSGQADGTGLGLSIAQSIINQHNGLIECVSEPGQTVFTVYLPVETGK